MADVRGPRLPAATRDTWNTWDAAWPASLVHLGSGACLRIGAYSASAGSYTGFRWSPEHTLGAHEVGGGPIEAEFTHAGTTLSLRAEAAGEAAVRVELRCTGLGEWGLRFWLIAEFGAWDPAGPAARLLVPEGERAYVEPPTAVLDAARVDVPVLGVPVLGVPVLGVPVLGVPVVGAVGVDAAVLGAAGLGAAGLGAAGLGAAGLEVAGVDAAGLEVAGGGLTGASATGAGLAAAFCPLDRPTDVRLAAGPGAIGRAMEAGGYYVRPPSPPGARYAVFRFAMTEPVVRFAAAAAPTPGAALARAREALKTRKAAEAITSRDAPLTRTRQTSAAVRDVLGWNTVWDRRNRRPYTASTRAWIDPKFGGFGVWQIDGFLHAVLAAHLGESWLAWANLDAVLDGRAAAGNLAALAAGTTYWADRSHPPFGAHVLWNVQAMVPDAARQQRAERILLDAFGWWFLARDGNRNGLLEYGSSPVGDGHFVHTEQAALDESANDNSPVHDGARFDPVTHTLDVEDVGLNSLLVHEGELLARMLEAAGHAGQARRVASRAAALAGAVRERLWDPDRRIFAGRHWDGRFTASLAPTSFYPLLAGIATREQAEAMVREWLTEPSRFGGDWPVAGTPHADPAAAGNTYWRGRTWPCFNYAVYQGLRRYRFDAEATWLARRGLEMFGRGWAQRRCYENFNQRTGEGGDSPDAEPFYTWGALLPFLADADLIGVDPWDGATFGRDGTEEASAATCIAGRRHEVTVTADSTVLSRDGAAVFSAGLRGRFRHLDTGSWGLAVEIPAAGREVTVTVTLPRPPTAVRVDNMGLPADRLRSMAEGAVSARLEPSADARRLEFLTRG